MAFTEKRLAYTFALSGGGEPIGISGLRSTCRIVASGPPTAGGIAEIAIYGMSLSQMNSLTVMATKQLGNVQKNEISISAGDTNGLSLIYKGNVFAAWADARAMPEVCFRVAATVQSYIDVQKIDPTSVKGSGDVAQMFQGLAKQGQFSFENNGVKTKLSNPYLSGSLGTQMRELAEHAGIQWVIDKGTLAIWPTGKSRQGGGALISPQTGMVGYPSFNEAGIIVTTLFNPSINYGQTVTIQSDITPACGQWTIVRQEYNLEAVTRHGAWFLDLVLVTADGQEPSGDQG